MPNKLSDDWPEPVPCPDCGAMMMADLNMKDDGVLYQGYYCMNENCESLWHWNTIEERSDATTRSDS